MPPRPVAATTTVTYTGPAETAKPRLHVLAIGIDQYSDTKFPKLSFARSDAEAFTRLMDRVGRDEIHFAENAVVARRPHDGEELFVERASDAFAN